MPKREGQIRSHQITWSALAETTAFATPWRRLSGWLIDYFVVGIVAGVLGALPAGSVGWDDYSRSLVGALLILGIWPVYSIVLTHVCGQTAGRMAVGIRVVNLADGRPPRWGRSTIRVLIQLGLVLLLVIPIFAALNYARILWDPRKQGWHDRAARTIVVRVRRRAVPEATTDSSEASETLPAAGWIVPPPAQLSRSRRAWLVLLTTVGALGLSGLLYGSYRYLEGDLVNVDFRNGSEPFEVGVDDAATYDLFDGTYRITLKQQGPWALTLGELRRTAHAIGVRAELVPVTQPEIQVGVGCVGDSPDGEGLAGYLFAVAPGGDFTLQRDGSVVREGSDPRISGVQHLSIMCVPDFGGDVFVLGLANGLEIVRYRDPFGHAEYTYAMLGVQGEPGAEVRFTKVWSRVPDEGWESET